MQGNIYRRIEFFAGVICMYRHECYEQLKLELPFGVNLNQENRWVKLAAMFPWDDIEQCYFQNFKGPEGQIAKPARLAFGALYIQSAEGYTDEQTRRNIQENPYLQYFCGFECYTQRSPFDASMMTYFRKRISMEMIQEITEKVFCRDACTKTDNAESDLSDDDTEEAKPIEKQEAETEVATDSGSANRGTLILDATCCPADIRYPTDVCLLNQARELSEKAIDCLYQTVQSQYAVKPRTYREKIRKEYLVYAKKRSHVYKETRKAIHHQLLCLKRNFHTLDDLEHHGAQLSTLDTELYRKLLIIHEIHRQQQLMYDQKSNRVEDRIVSIEQPHVRPIVRGKVGSPVEFGAKVTIGLVGGYAFVANADWNNFAESKVLAQAAEQYRQLFGVYPKTILGDRAYPVRENRYWCHKHGIRLSGPRLGRKSVEEKEEESKQIYQDSCERNAVEGTFGVCKRRYGLARIMTRLPDSSMTSIAMGFFAANMERKLRLLFAPQIDWALDYDYDLLSLIIFPRNSESLVIQ